MNHCRAVTEMMRFDRLSEFVFAFGLCIIDEWVYDDLSKRIFFEKNRHY
ncbi:hypothetical protein SAMN02745124_02564 [Desulfofustis glycolicus DSM 9705]|uniref:Uncharacterized protein n=1 Tax=Desulfofustis glycolicus DSM 9705 TaxID=1121409 RepID=A0A1M5WVV0_9BACT|nr:hypothetical protein SAMN02745124_02564 [Desulfofustis glycolicus DSM 9705]